MLRREGRIFTNMRAKGALLVVGLLGATAGGALGFSPECGMGSFGSQLRSPSPSCCNIRSPAPASLQLAMKEEGAKGDNDVFTGGEQLKIMMMRTRLEEENLEVLFLCLSQRPAPPPASQVPFVPVRSTLWISHEGDVPFNPHGLTDRKPGRENFNQLHAHCHSLLERLTCGASSASIPCCCRQLDDAHLLVAADEIFSVCTTSGTLSQTPACINPLPRNLLHHPVLCMLPMPRSKMLRHRMACCAPSLPAWPPACLSFADKGLSPLSPALLPPFSSPLLRRRHACT
jgi:hypothetical protein